MIKKIVTEIMFKLLLVLGGLVGLFPVVSGYHYVKGSTRKAGYDSDPLPCPGVYCGRKDLNETHYSGCGKCDRGWRVGNNTHSLCEKCNLVPEKNDWFFLAFHVITVLVMQLVAIDFAARRRYFTKEVLLLHFCAIVEVVCAAVITILAVEPFGELALTSCRVRRLHDWYTFFQNPNPNFEETLNCTQEAGTV